MGRRPKRKTKKRIRDYKFNYTEDKPPGHPWEEIKHGTYLGYKQEIRAIENPWRKDVRKTCQACRYAWKVHCREKEIERKTKKAAEIEDVIDRWWAEKDIPQRHSED